MAATEDVYCTLVMSDDYLPGAAVLAHSLRDAGTKKKLACLITQETLRDTTITELQSLYNYVIPIERIGNPNPANLYLMNRPDLLYTFTKINLWRLEQFRKIVYIDSDVVALRAPDELFDVQEDFAAAPDVGWPDAFNTGVMVLAPQSGEYWAMRRLASAGDSFDGADQGLLNQYYEHRPWKRLSFTYNCTPSGNYQYEPAYRYYKSDIKMVHFIGSNKPWHEDRSDHGAPGVYQELLSRWWAVYDRHFTASTYEYAATGRHEPSDRKPPYQQVRDAHLSKGNAYYASGYPSDSTQPALPQEARGTSTEVPLTEPTDTVEAIDQGLIQPVPTAEQRRFSAPHSEWDATRGAPPAISRPEASNFPTQNYEFTNDPAPWKPPSSYPAPPSDLYYQIPKEKPRPREPPPKPIFPWEERKDAPRPARVFTDEIEPQSEPTPELESDFAGADEFEVSVVEKKQDLVEPKTPTITLNDEPWAAFGAVNRNAWDEVSGIDDYVRALTASHRKHGKVQVLRHNEPASDSQALQQVLSPMHEPEPAEYIDQVRERRESLILTDFPTAMERPSLPVTPAPRRRPNFWGTERDEDGDLPGAEGVPDQADWDPNAQLEQLRRNSLIGPSDLSLPDRSNIPRRNMPGSAEPITEEALAQPYESTGVPDLDGSTEPASAGTNTTATQQTPAFSEPSFGGPSTGTAVKEAVLSPTQSVAP